MISVQQTKELLDTRVKTRGGTKNLYECSDSEFLSYLQANIRYVRAEYRLRLRAECLEAINQSKTKKKPVRWWKERKEYE
jgi:hypothetical protein